MGEGSKKRCRVFLGIGDNGTECSSIKEAHRLAWRAALDVFPEDQLKAVECFEQGWIEVRGEGVRRRRGLRLSKAVRVEGYRRKRS